MGLTLASYILLPLSAFWMASPGKLLQLVALVSCFEAAAALTFGDVGVQPGLVPALAFIAFILLQMLLGVRFPGQADIARVMRPFWLVTVYAVGTSFLMPHIFEDQVLVWPQKFPPSPMATELVPTSSNINQDIYLVINCLFLFLAACYLTRPRLALAPFARAFLLSGFVVAAVSAWQFANRVAGVPYPADLFYSNPGWAILTEQSIGLVPRINGPFSEPAALASYMVAVVCAAGWLLLRGHRDRMLWWLLIVGLITMLLSTSTTGFAALAIIGAGAPVYALVSGSKRMMASTVRVGLPLIVLAGLVLLTLPMFMPTFQQDVEEVTAATLDKEESSSYTDRTGADRDSLNATVGTYFLGVGWGSNRSSSLIPGLLAGLGLPGCIGLLWFGFRVTRQVRTARRLGCSDEQCFVMDTAAAGMFGFLLAAVVSSPTISSTVFFLLLALLIASAARARLDARVAAAVSAPEPFGHAGAPALPGWGAAATRHPF